MATPEGRVKEKIKKILDGHRGSIYYFMPVPSGYGKPSLDYLGAAGGHAFAIEAKAPDEEPTTRQDLTIKAMLVGGVKVFVIDGKEAQLQALDTWLGEQVA